MRISTGRRVGTSRVYSLKPVTLPTDHLLLRRSARMRRERGRGKSRNSQDAFVFVREDLDEFRKCSFPVLQRALRLVAGGEFEVSGNQPMQRLDILGSRDGLEVHAFAIAEDRRKIAGIVQDIGDAAGHSRGKVAPRASQHHDQTLGHVLATVVANAFNNRGGAGIAYRKALPGHAVEVRFTAGRAVQAYVADKNILLRGELGGPWWIENQFSARKSFADIVVGLALQRQCYPVRQKRAKALPGAPRETHANGVFGQACRTIAPRNLPAQHRSHSTVDVSDAHAQGHGCAALQRLPRLLD